MKKVLFILKRKEDFNPIKDSVIGLSTGLYNSASFMHLMLLEAGFHSSMSVVIDNNDIDREVTKNKPDVVIIEALWVTPTKFSVLQKLHPTVKWIVRLHSELPFLANEGIAMDWVGDYIAYKNVFVSANAPRMLSEASQFAAMIGNANKIIYLPNAYPKVFKHKEYNIDKREGIDIGCFGAVRPLKNHLVQAMASIKFANEKKKKLRFHINGNRIEMKGEPVMHNLQGLFQHIAHLGHQLVSHQWTPREEFLKLCATMDIGLQVSFSETFNIVGADIISQGVPMVTCLEIPWAYEKFNASPVDSDDIFRKMLLVHDNANENVVYNQHNINRYSEKTKEIWVRTLKGI